MPLDPRTPVIAGVGQIVNRPVLDDPSTWTEPLALMVGALRIAGEDAAGRKGPVSALLGRLDELTVIPPFVWHVADPALAVAREIGIAPARTRVAFPGGTTPQTLLFDATTRIASGDVDVVAVVGAEAVRSRNLARSLGEPVTWREQGDDVAAATVYGEVPAATTELERAVGLAVPVHAYALFEQALRRRAGRTAPAHLDVLGRLAARMSEVASTNELAWIREARTAASITTPSASNRMVSYPYTKLLTSNVVVDMGAAYIVCSLEAARVAGVPDDQLVFPQAGATAREQWFISERAELGRSLAMGACKHRLFGDGASGVDSVGHFDLYSCFPSVVQMAGDALGLDVWEDPRPPTVTGGLTFFGGPGNNYVTHSLATMTEVLRSHPSATGLVTALGWYCSTHAWGTYASSPPVGGFELHDAQPLVDEASLRDVDEEYTGAGEVESYTVAHDRDGAATRAIVSVLGAGGVRRIVGVDDPVVAAAVLAADPLGATIHVDASGLRLP